MDKKEWKRVKGLIDQIIKDQNDWEKYLDKKCREGKIVKMNFDPSRESQSMTWEEWEEMKKEIKKHLKAVGRDQNTALPL